MIEFSPIGVMVAYAVGVFPMWLEDDQAIGWFRPNPRAILPLDGFHTSRSLAKTIRQGRFEVRFNTAFEQVMHLCADRPEGSWINDDFYRVYGELFDRGWAHCVECWRDGELVGGTYGVAIGGAFMAESMFHRERDASKVALAALVDRLNSRGFHLLDVQFLTPHLQSLGAIEIPSQRYNRELQRVMFLPCRFEDPTQLEEMGV